MKPCLVCGADIARKRGALVMKVDDGSTYYACPGACTAEVDAMIAEEAKPGQVNDRRKN